MKHNFEYKDVQGTTPLAAMFNRVLTNFTLPRIMFSPEFNGYRNLDTDGVIASFTFYQTYLFECYCHTVIDRLTEWAEMVSHYNEEFAGSWKYYALADYLALIKEYGGDESDYLEDGTIKKTFTNKELLGSTLVYRMRDYNSIFLNTKPTDMEFVMSTLINKTSMSPFKVMEKITGEPITTFRKDDKGEFVKNTWVDTLLYDMAEKDNLTTLAAILFSTVTTIYNLVTEVLKLKPTEDNKAFFESLPKRIDDIFNLKILLVKNQKKGGAHV